MRILESSEEGPRPDRKQYPFGYTVNFCSFSQTGLINVYRGQVDVLSAIKLNSHDSLRQLERWILKEFERKDHDFFEELEFTELT